MNKYRTCIVSHLGIIECKKKTMLTLEFLSYIHNESVNSINLMAKKHRDEAKNSPLRLMCGNETRSSPYAQVQATQRLRFVTGDYGQISSVKLMLGSLDWSPLQHRR